MARLFCLGSLILLMVQPIVRAGDVPPEGPPSGSPPGGDMTFCELFDLRQFGRVDDIVGLSVATTSWNIGSADLLWFDSPDEEHPFIAMNLYRLKDDRFDQIGQSWVKHGFFAQSNTNCGEECTYEDLPGHGVGDWLGMGCTDTYSASLNANRVGLGPRFEVNPWTGAWSYQDSHFSQGGSPNPNAIDHRLQVRDADLDPALNEGAQYFIEGYYVVLDDVNVMNNAAWKPVVPISTQEGLTWVFSMSNPLQPPSHGFAIDAWVGASQTMIAQEVPPVEFQSPDGRCILAGKATDLEDGFWRYEYALLNIDMDRQVGGFRVPMATGATVRTVGFHAVRHHNEPVNAPGGVPINNAAWTPSAGGGAVEWTTNTNPLRWGTLYNFWFETNLAPVSDAEITLTHFKPGDPTSLVALAIGPSPVSPDCDQNEAADLEEIASDPGLDCNGNFTLDLCESSPDSDSDGDGILNECDPCPADNPDDSDGDGVCDGEDICQGFDDAADTDLDGLPDGCDPCPLDNPADTDEDGVCDDEDRCPGFDDAADGDSDGVPDSCDPCPLDTDDDSDLDGVCDSYDVCPGLDDALAAVGECEPDPDPPPVGECEAAGPLQAFFQVFFGCCAPQTVIPLGLTVFGLICLRGTLRRRPSRGA